MPCQTDAFAAMRITASYGNDGTIGIPTRFCWAAANDQSESELGSNREIVTSIAAVTRAYSRSGSFHIPQGECPKSTLCGRQKISKTPNLSKY